MTLFPFPGLRRPLHILLFAMALLAMVSPSISAQDNRQIPGYQSDANSRLDNRGEDRWSFVLGAGAGYFPLTEGSRDLEFFPLPVFSINYRDVAYIDFSDGVGVSLISTDTTYLSIDANIATSRSEEENSNGLFNDGDFERFAGLGDVDGDIALEIYASQVIFEMAEVSVSARREFGNVDGWQVTAGVASGYEVTDGWFFGGQVAATWSSANYSRAFFGVTEAQAANRADIAATNPIVNPYDAFTAGAGMTSFSFGVGLSHTFGKNDQFFATLDAGYSFGLGDLKNSPVTERANVPSGTLTFGWRF